MQFILDIVLDTIRRPYFLSYWRYERRRIFTRSIVKMRPTAIESPTMELRLSSEQGCLPSSNPYIREAKSNGMEWWETGRDIDEGKRKPKGEERDWHWVEKQDRVREKRAGGTRCCLLNPRDQYDVPYLFVPRNIADDSTRDTRTYACSRYHIARGEVRCCADWFRIFYDTVWQSFRFLKKLQCAHYLFVFLYKVNWDSISNKRKKSV